MVETTTDRQALGIALSRHPEDWLNWVALADWQDEQGFHNDALMHRQIGECIRVGRIEHEQLSERAVAWLDRASSVGRIGREVEVKVGASWKAAVGKCASTWRRGLASGEVKYVATGEAMGDVERGAAVITTNDWSDLGVPMYTVFVHPSDVFFFTQ